MAAAKKPVKKPLRRQDFKPSDRRPGFDFVCAAIAAENPTWSKAKVETAANVTMTEVRVESAPGPLKIELGTSLAAELTKPKSMFAQAEAVIYGDREKTYGSPDKNLVTISEFWSVYLKNKFGAKFKLDTDDVCLLMDLLKTARLINTPTHFDTMLDKMGYIGLMDRVQKHQGRTE